MFLLVDGGATKTHILLINKDLSLIKEYKLGPFNFSAIISHQAVPNLKAMLGDIEIKKIKKAVFGLSGVDTLTEKLKTQQLFAAHFSFPFQIVNDSEIALLAGSTHPDSVVIIAGTGSNCFGRNHLGETAKTSGLDWLLADEGSGFAIGHAILKAAIRSFDGRGLKTCLENLVCDHFSIDHIYDLKHHFYEQTFSKDKIAQLAQLLPMALGNDDQVAKLILENNIGELLISLRPVVSKLNLQNQYFELVLAGSLFTNNLIPFTEFAYSVRREFPQAKIILLDQAPVYGAIELLKSSN